MNTVIFKKLSMYQRIMEKQNVSRSIKILSSTSIFNIDNNKIFFSTKLAY